MRAQTAWTGLGAFSPASLPGLTLWLPFSAASIAAGTITWADQSGNHLDCSLAATTCTLVAASSGIPAHVASPGNQALTGLPLPNLGTATTFFILRRVPLNSTQCGFFNAFANVTYDYIHDRNGAPGRAVWFCGGGTPVAADNSTAWVVDTLLSDGAGSPTGTLYRNGASVASAVVTNPGNTTAGYQVFGPGLGVTDACDIAEVILCRAALSAASIAKTTAFLLARIPP